MAQPFEHDQTGVSLWTVEHIEARQQAVREAASGGRTLNGADESRDPIAEAEAEGWYEGFDDADIMAIEEAELEAGRMAGERANAKKQNMSLNSGGGGNDGGDGYAIMEVDEWMKMQSTIDEEPLVSWALAWKEHTITEKADLCML